MLFLASDISIIKKWAIYVTQVYVKSLLIKAIRFNLLGRMSRCSMVIKVIIIMIIVCKSVNISSRDCKIPENSCLKIDCGLWTVERVIAVS